MLGVGLPLASSLISCKKEEFDYDGNVLIIGAGAAGLTAGYLLQKGNVQYQILEASSTYGGRMKRTTDFADFPLPLGAEWLHVETGVFAEIVDNSSVDVSVATTPYDPNTDYGLFQGEQISVQEVGFTIDRKFIGSTWFDFYDQYIVPSVSANISYNKVVESIDYSGDQVVVRTADEEFTADRVIFTAPLKMLQNRAITFTPALPRRKQNAIDDATVWDGCKAFIEFSDKFYPAFTAYETVPETAGQKLYYDAAYGQNSSRHILGLFAVGSEATIYNEMAEGDRIGYMLNELDAIYNGQASAGYVKHIFQNWNAEPYINGAYLYDHENWGRVGRLAETVDNKILFAGEAYGFSNDWGSVHVAARAAKRAVEEIVS